jgi:hypothetical protein
VFRFVATDCFQSHPRCDPDVVEVRQTSAGPVDVGTTAQVVRGQGRRRATGTVTVTAYDPDRLAAWAMRIARFELLQRSEYIAEKHGRATRLRLTIETRAKGPIGVGLPLMRSRFRRTMTKSLSIIRTLIGHRCGQVPTARASLSGKKPEARNERRAPVAPA